jgi:hypothetical protein
MRLTLFVLVMLPIGAQAQETTSAPAAPLAQSQSCPVGMAWDATAQVCAMSHDGASPMKDLSNGSNCNYSAPREVMS